GGRLHAQARAALPAGPLYRELFPSHCRWAGRRFQRSQRDWISERGNNDWDLVGRLFESNRLDGRPSEDDIWFELNQFCCKSGQTLRMKIRIPVNHFKIPTFHVTKFSHACQKLIEKSHDEGVAFRRKR